jgi:hypothetical protein
MPVSSRPDFVKSRHRKEIALPDMTLDEIVAAMGQAGIAGSRTAVWRFYERHDISF